MFLQSGTGGGVVVNLFLIEMDEMYNPKVPQ